MVLLQIQNASSGIEMDYIRRSHVLLLGSAGAADIAFSHAVDAVSFDTTGKFGVKPLNIEGRRSRDQHGKHC